VGVDVAGREQDVAVELEIEQAPADAANGGFEIGERIVARERFRGVAVCIDEDVAALAGGVFVVFALDYCVRLADRFKEPDKGGTDEAAAADDEDQSDSSSPGAGWTGHGSVLPKIARNCSARSCQLSRSANWRRFWRKVSSRSLSARPTCATNSEGVAAR